MRSTRWIVALAALLVLVGTAPALARGTEQEPETTTIATGLENPRGIAVGSNGVVYVAESGRGGDRLALGVIQGSPAMVCVGETGGITRISKRGNVARVVDLPSFAAASNRTGPRPRACGV